MYSSYFLHMHKVNTILTTTRLKVMKTQQDVVSHTFFEGWRRIQTKSATLYRIIAIFSTSTH